MELPADDGGRSRNPSNQRKRDDKSCKGCLYYSSALNSKWRNPKCIGKLSSTVPTTLVKEMEAPLYKDAEQMAEFNYVCIGYSVHMEKKCQLTKKSELPFCVGLEVVESGADNVLVDPYGKEDGLSSPQPRSYKPAPVPASPAREEFINRFSRSATLIASCVIKNANKVCNQIKSANDDILYPYRRPPK